jgi:hypothetical protein
MRGQLVAKMKKAKTWEATHPMLVNDYRAALVDYSLTPLQTLVIAYLMYEEQVPPYPFIIKGIIHPFVTVTKELEALQ